MPEIPAAARSQPAARAAQQCADAVLMIRPAAFGFNPETATTNAFQRPQVADPAATLLKARAEFEQLAHALAVQVDGGKGVQVLGLQRDLLVRIGRTASMRSVCCSHWPIRIASPNVNAEMTHAISWPMAVAPSLRTPIRSAQKTI